MKTKTYILTFFIFLSGVALNAQHAFIDAQFKGVYNNDTLVLNLNSLGYASYTIYFNNNDWYGEQGKHSFRYKNSKDITFKDGNTILFSIPYDKGVVELKREIPSKDEKFLKVNISVPGKTYTTEFKDYGNDVKNNISLINHLNLLDFVLFDNEHHTSGSYNLCCAGCKLDFFYHTVSFREIEKNDKRNIMKISGCDSEYDFQVFRFEYDSSDKLSEIKTSQYLCKLEWL